MGSEPAGSKCSDVQEPGRGDRDCRSQGASFVVCCLGCCPAPLPDAGRTKKEENTEAGRGDDVEVEERKEKQKTKTKTEKSLKIQRRKPDHIP